VILAGRFPARHLSGHSKPAPARRTSPVSRPRDAALAVRFAVKIARHRSMQQTRPRLADDADGRAEVFQLATGRVVLQGGSRVGPRQAAHGRAYDRVGEPVSRLDEVVQRPLVVLEGQGQSVRCHARSLTLWAAAAPRRRQRQREATARLR
jgi:hypothetical protein